MAEPVAAAPVEPVSRLPAPIRGMRAAFVFLTRVPVGGFPYRSEDWRWSAAHFPLVGAVVGLASGAVFRALLPLGGLAAALLAIGVQLLLTGAFHEDGLADTADALGGAYEPKRVMEILHDSRIGTFGAVALIVSMGARAVLLGQLGGAALWLWPLVGCAARVGPIWLMWAMPYATPAERSKSREVTRGGAAQALVALAWLVVLASALVAWDHLAPARILVMLALLAAVTTLCGWRFHRRLGGVTGDFLGATEQLGELAVLAVLAWPA